MHVKEISELCCCLSDLLILASIGTSSSSSIDLHAQSAESIEQIIGYNWLHLFIFVFASLPVMARIEYLLQWQKQKLQKQPVVGRWRNSSSSSRGRSTNSSNKNTDRSLFNACLAAYKSSVKLNKVDWLCVGQTRCLIGHQLSCRLVIKSHFLCLRKSGSPACHEQRRNCRHQLRGCKNTQQPEENI